MTQKRRLAGFVVFKAFTGRGLTIILYWIGAAWITFSGISLLFPGAERIPYLDEIRNPASWKRTLIGLSLIILGNLIWRILCEAGAAVFSIREDLHCLRTLLESRPGETIPPGQPARK